MAFRADLLMHQLLHFFAVDLAFGLCKAAVGLMEHTAPLHMVGPGGACDRMDKVHARPFFLCAIEKDLFGLFRKLFPGGMDAEVIEFGQVVVDIAIADSLVGACDGAAVLRRCLDSGSMILSRSNSLTIPRPLQRGHMPEGLLKEKSCGSKEV